MLLCTDGLWGQIPTGQLEEYFKRYKIDYALDKLAHDAEANGFPRSDNISGIAFRWVSNAKSQPSHYQTQPKDLEELDHLADGLEDMTRKLDQIEKDIT